MKRIVEIRPAEGGEDAQMFTGDLAVAFEKLCLRQRWKSRRLVERISGTGYLQISIEVDGEGCERLAVEVGGHRIQRIPPTEKRGRVHTSTVTVAVMQPEEVASPVAVHDRDLQVTWFSGTGKGGQHRNKHQNSCRVLHIPSGITETRQSREKDANLREAKDAIAKRLQEKASGDLHSTNAVERRTQVGSGMRGDKTVTIRFQDDAVTHHVTGKSGAARRYMRGEMDLLW